MGKLFDTASARMAIVAAAAAATVVAGCVATGVDVGTLGARASLSLDPGSGALTFGVAKPTGGLLEIESPLAYTYGGSPTVKCGEDAQGSYDDCAVITTSSTGDIDVKATAKPGYRFAGWTHQSRSPHTPASDLCTGTVNPCVTSWSETASLAATFQKLYTLASDPAAIRFGGTNHIFARTDAGELWHRPNDDPLGVAENFGGAMTHGPAVASWGPGRLDAFVRGADGALHQKWFDGIWRPWARLTASNTIHSDPVAVSWGPNRIDVFARSATGGIVQVYWDGSLWREYHGLAEGRTVPYGLGVSSRGVGKLDLFYRGADNAIHQRTYDGEWGPWTTIPSSAVIASDPDAVSYDSGHIDLFARATNGQLVQFWWDSTGWHGPVYLGGSLTSGVSVSTRGPGLLDVFARGADGRLIRKSQEAGNRWQAWTAAIE